MNLPIRARLTLWYVAMLALMLLLLAAGVMVFVVREQRMAVDRALRQRVAEFATAFAAEAREEESDKAAEEAVSTLARSDGALFVYARPKRLIAHSPVSAAGIPFAALPRETTLFTAAGFRCIVAPLDATHVLVATQDLAAQRAAFAELRRALLLSIPAALLLAAFGGYLLARRSLAPVARMTADASRIEAQRLSARITITSDDEIGRLGAVLNALLARLEQSFAQQRQLVADTSHELRTPVSVIRSEADVTLSRERSADEYREALDVIRSESVHLTRLIEDLLLMARADAQQLPLQAKEFALRDVVEDAARSMRTLAGAKGVELTAATDGAMPMRGDPELVRRMLVDLLDNGVKFTPPGGRVEIATRTENGRYVIAVRDSGCGIAAEAQPHVFDRFYRADRARTAGAGAGLGLAIAQSIAELHGCEVRLVRSDASGSLFEVTLTA